MQRRAFLRALGAVTATGALAACTRSGASGPPEGEAELNLLRASYELLTGEDQRFAFSLTTLDNEPVVAEGVEVFVRDAEGEPVAGPFAAPVHDLDDLPRPVYIASVSIEQPGNLEMVAVAGDRHGTGVMQVVRPEDSALPAPGDPAPPTPTLTVDDAEGVQLCTRQPQCDMHEHSLDAVLEQGRPVMMLFATPAYCQTAVCGPVLDVLEDVRESADWGDLAFVHSEIYDVDEDDVDGEHDHDDHDHSEDDSEAGHGSGAPALEPLPAVVEWGLPTEPWLFAIDSDGIIVDRLDGPVLPDELEALAERLTA